MPWDFDKARAKGIDVEQVGRSWAHHLSEERQRVRDNPKLLEQAALPERYDLVVVETVSGAGRKWESHGALPEDLPPLSATATELEAVLNHCTARELLERRYLGAFGRELFGTGLYGPDLAARRKALAVAQASRVHIIDPRDMGAA